MMSMPVSQVNSFSFEMRTTQSDCYFLSLFAEEAFNVHLLLKNGSLVLMTQTHVAEVTTPVIETTVATPRLDDDIYHLVAVSVHTCSPKITLTVHIDGEPVAAFVHNGTVENIAGFDVRIDGFQSTDLFAETIQIGGYTSGQPLFSIGAQPNFIGFIDNFRLVKVKLL